MATVRALFTVALLAAALPGLAAEELDRQLPGLARDDLQSGIIEALFNNGANPRGPYAESAIYLAVKHGQPRNLAVLMARGVPADKEYRGDDYSPPRKLLTFASAGGNEEIVGLLLRQGAAANTRNDFPFQPSIHGTPPHRHQDNKKTALMYAAQAGHSGVVRQLLKAGADPNLSTVYDESALMLAAGNGCAETVKPLLDARAKLNAEADDTSFDARMRTDYGGTALGYALRAVVQGRHAPGKCGDYQNTIDGILSAYESTRTRVGNAPVIMRSAVMRGDSKTIARLIALGAVRRGSDALLNAGFNGRDNAEVVRLLVDAGADVNARMDEPYNETALMRAAGSGASATAVALLDARADINAENTFGETALWSAARANRPGMVELLLKRGADPNRVTRPNPQWFSEGGSALNVAVEKGCMECARLLLASGANPRVADAKGRTPEEALRKAGLVR